VELTGSALVRLLNVSKEFPTESGILATLLTRLRKGEIQVCHAVRDVSLAIDRGETLGLVGESGCGKSTLGKCILRLIEPTSGDIWFEDKNITSLGKESLRKLRPRMQMIFQDPYSSLNPRMTIKDILGYALEVTNGSPSKEKEEIICQLMETVGLSPQHLGRYPHQFSGGQKQRIAIARALVPKPLFLIADEPVSSLDVSVQSQIINLIKDLQQRLGLTILFITHDLSVVQFISSKVAVMYIGRIVEIGPTEELFDEPLHPYTRALLSAAPMPDPRSKRRRIVLRGDPASPLYLPIGCAFQNRCPYVKPICMKAEPTFVRVSGGHRVACYLYGQRP
jgi:oligopeptide transport system ATP-binding protein